MLYFESSTGNGVAEPPVACRRCSLAMRVGGQCGGVAPVRPYETRPASVREQ